MQVHENIAKNTHVLDNWTSYQEAEVKSEKGVVTTTGGTSVLKAYYSLASSMTKSPILGYKYTISFKLENLSPNPIRIRINGLDISTETYPSDFRGQVVLTGYRIDDKLTLQIQLRTQKVEDSIKAKITDICISEYKNLLKTQDLKGKWLGYAESTINERKDGSIHASAGNQTGVLKAYVNLIDILDTPLEVGKSYKLSFYFENLRENPVYIAINGLSIPKYEVEPNFKGTITLSGERVSNDDYLQLQVHSHAPEYYVVFVCNSPYIFEEFEESLDRLWIPSKAELKKPSLYPDKVGGGTEFTEIKPL